MSPTRAGVRVPVVPPGARPFQTCGYTGFALAVACGAALVEHQGLSQWILCAISGTAAAMFFALAVATRIVTGVERLIYYHHEIAIVAAVTVCVWLTGHPILPYVDVAILGIGVFLTCGRVGCLLVGCCHGRPAGWGISYQPAHTRAGFPERLVGVTLLPVQAVEALVVAGVVASGVVLVLSGAPSGDALAWYVVCYGTARFFLEFARGDRSRRYWMGFSEAQWTSLVLMGAGVLAQWVGLIAVHRWQEAATFGIVATMICIASRRCLRTRRPHVLPRPARVALSAPLDLKMPGGG